MYTKSDNIVRSSAQAAYACPKSIQATTLKNDCHHKSGCGVFRIYVLDFSAPASHVLRSERLGLQVAHYPQWPKLTWRSE